MLIDNVTLIGSMAAVCTTISFVPQVVKVYRTKHARDLSLPMYVIFSIGLILWLTYGIMIGSTPVIAANGITLLLCGYILFMKLRFGGER